MRISDWSADLLPCILISGLNRHTLARTHPMRSGNPALKDSTFLDLGSGTVVSRAAGGAMTLNGTVGKTAVLLVLAVMTAAFAWSKVAITPDGMTGGLYVWGGLIGGFILAMVTIFKKEWAPVTAPMYALVEGLFLGGISAVFEARYPGIAFQAVLLTFGTLFALLMAYRSGLITATENFKMGVVAATGGIALVYLATLVLCVLGVEIPLVLGNGLVGMNRK